MIKVSPSVLACDLSKLCDEVKSIELAGADMVHIDVMDGVFVTNISFGLAVIESIRKNSKMVFDVHLMIVEPEKYVERFVDAGADIVTFHHEATKDTEKTLKMIKAKGAKAAVSVKPGTPIEAIYPYLELCDMVLIMTVEPGFGGQAFMEDMMPKVRALRDEITRRGLDIDIQVDGGISDKTIAVAAGAGANVFVAGSAVFAAPDSKAMIAKLRQLAAEAF